MNWTRLLACIVALAIAGLLVASEITNRKMLEAMEDTASSVGHTRDAIERTAEKLDLIEKQQKCTNRRLEDTLDWLQSSNIASEFERPAARDFHNFKQKSRERRDLKGNALPPDDPCQGL